MEAHEGAIHLSSRDAGEELGAGRAPRGREEQIVQGRRKRLVAHRDRRAQGTFPVTRPRAGARRASPAAAQRDESGQRGRDENGAASASKERERHV
jgi:hypothetical protein